MCSGTVTFVGVPAPVAPLVPDKAPPLGDAAVPLVALPISGRPNNASVGALIAASADFAAACNGAASAASAARYDAAPEFQYPDKLLMECVGAPAERVKLSTVPGEHCRHSRRHLIGTGGH